MPRAAAIVIFLTVVTTLTLVVHGYLYLRLLRDPGWPRRVRRAGGLALGLLALSIPVGFVGSRTLPRDAAMMLSTFAFGWMGVMFFLLVGCVVGDAMRLLARAAHRAVNVPWVPERRQALARFTAGSVAVATGGAVRVSVGSALGEVEIAEQAVKLDRLPRALDGLQIAQLSDVHIGASLGGRFLRGVVEKTNALRPDLIVITGDLVDGSVAQLERHVAPLAELRSRFGVFFVTGNHEFYSGADAWCAHLERLGMNVLRNRVLTLGSSRAEKFQLAGIDDHTLTGGTDVGARLRTRIDPERETILLAHQPRSVEDAAALGAGLQLAGHTHGGQIYPFTELVRLTTPYVAGLYRHSEQTQIYVSRGTGFWGPPMRLAAPAEITRLVLTV
jgi:predicted MPP superfamily phosphohydrolase